VKPRPNFPANPDFPKVEIGLLIDLKRIDEANSGLENQIKKRPNNKILISTLATPMQTLNNGGSQEKL
jgi:hypothetical protein